MPKSEAHSIPFLVKGDFDGFIGLFIDNLINLLLITGLCLGVLKMPVAIVMGKILPATALSVLAGNISYAWIARKIAIKENRRDVTALPYGINTVTLLIFFSLIIAPVYNDNIKTLGTEGAAILAWKVGIISCLISGIFEGLGAFLGDKIRKITPRAALLSTLAGIAIGFIALNHTVPIWGKPLIAFVPLALIIIEYFTQIKLPFKIPAGLYALAIGAIIAWSTGQMQYGELTKATGMISFYIPKFMLIDMFDGVTLSKVLPYLSISIPLGLMSFFGTIQNLESAEAAGDRFPATPVLAINGIGTVFGAFFGSPFPTTVYIGHPGWKGLGARSGYSVINGAVITIICFTGLMSLIKALVPLEAGYPILLWIGIIITAQAFQTTPKAHAPAVALGIMPAIAGWGLMITRRFITSHLKISDIQADKLFAKTVPDLKGIIPFQEGALFTAMFLSALAVYIIEKKFLRAFYWSLPLIAFSFIGIIHSHKTGTIGFGKSGNIPYGYMLFSLVLLFVFLYTNYVNKSNNSEHGHQ